MVNDRATFTVVKIKNIYSVLEVSSGWSKNEIDMKQIKQEKETLITCTQSQ